MLVASNRTGFGARSIFQYKDLRFNDLKSFLEAASQQVHPTNQPTAGGTLRINGQSLGSYDIVLKTGNQTISSFTASDWFTATADTRSAIIIVQGDLTIDVGQTFIPSVRKLFTAIYVKGNLIVNGSISMSARGANHSGTTATAIRLANGTFSAVTNPEVPATGGAGGAQNSRGSSGLQNGNAGTAGSAGGTGGGGSGGVAIGISGTATSPVGASGTSFSGGPGSGGCSISNVSANAGGGTANGGAGGAGGGALDGSGGGAGNPGGSPTGSGVTGSSGTGGVLFILVSGNYSGSGSVVAAGAAGGNGATASGSGAGGSGGGSITMLIRGSDTGPTPTALGGAGGTVTAVGGAGGNGTARKLAY